jgi:ribosome assembly protein YihI (activator of Der GTPase)
MGKYKPRYQKMLDEGLYVSIEELCEDLGLDYEDVYDDSDFEDDESTDYKDYDY